MTTEQKIKFIQQFILDKSNLDKFDAQILVYIEYIKPTILDNLLYLSNVDELIQYIKFLRYRCIDTTDGFVYRFGIYNPMHQEILDLFSDNFDIGIYWADKQQIIIQHNVRWWHFYHLHRHLAYF